MSAYRLCRVCHGRAEWFTDYCWRCRRASERRSIIAGMKAAAEASEIFRRELTKSRDTGETVGKRGR